MICNKNMCSGCQACFNICPKNAIVMKEDSLGFKYPKIDKSKCINCGLCRSVCQALNEVKYNKVLECYAAYSNNEDVHNNSTSGGIATTLSDTFIKSGNIVYGVSYNPTKLNFEHKRCTNSNEILELRGSKYVQSNINYTYKLVREDLLNKKKVLFIGTPCQISGLKFFLKRDFENLFLLDLVCHGVSSKKILDEEIGFNDYKEISFRKNKRYILSAKNSEKTYEKDLNESPYLRFFLNSYSLRESCGNCLYANEDRISDITIGDFWGLERITNFGSKEKGGVSLVLINSNKGKELLSSIKDKIIFEQEDYEKSKRDNQPLNQPSVNKFKSLIFKSLIKFMGINKTYNVFKKTGKGGN